VLHPSLEEEGETRAVDRQASVKTCIGHCTIRQGQEKVFGSCSPDRYGGDIDVELSCDLVQHLLRGDHWIVATNGDKQRISECSFRLVNGAQMANDAERSSLIVRDRGGGLRQLCHSRQG
jgi:hypothetical protein